MDFTTYFHPQEQVWPVHGCPPLGDTNVWDLEEVYFVLYLWGRRVANDDFWLPDVAPQQATRFVAGKTGQDLQQVGTVTFYQTVHPGVVRGVARTHLVRVMR